MESNINVFLFIPEFKEVHKEIIHQLSEREERFHFSIAQNFEEFYYFLEKFCNIAILDSSLNKEDLKYTIKKIKEKNIDIPILFISKNYEDSEADSLFSLGIKDIIQYNQKNKLFHILLREYETQKLLNERRELLFSSQMNEELYRSLIELQSGFIRKITSTGNYIYVNQAYCDYIKKSRKEVYSENLFLSLPAVSREAYMRHIKGLTPQKSSATIEYFTYSEEGLKYQVWTDH
ncbi:MAG: hypothetical protein N3A69_01170, partial [Leptospiraceae bacterium]|nr:hypothetical protein [Leptospiraceae bacterium]